MEPFNVYILGCGSALPTPKHMASSQVVEIRGKQFLVDCGEGTQLQIRRSHINFNKIQAIMGSSNLTYSGLTGNGEMNAD